jgi:hypothetical protein
MDKTFHRLKFPLKEECKKIALNNKKYWIYTPES